MKFIVIVIAMFIERFFPQVQDLRDLKIFDRYCRAMRIFMGNSKLVDGVVGIVFVMIPAALVIGWLQTLLSKGLLVLFGLLFAVLALVASTGPRDIGGLLRAYLNAIRTGHESVAVERAEDIIGGAVPAVVGERNRAVVHAVLRQINEWLPAVLFWFAVLGPVGAVLYRLLYALYQQSVRDNEESSFADAVERVYVLAGWLPARGVVLAYALTGSFVDTMQAWKTAVQSRSTQRHRQSQDALLVVGLGALGFGVDAHSFSDHQVQLTLDLLRRVLVVWLVAFALLTLTGFLH